MPRSENMPLRQATSKAKPIFIESRLKGASRFKISGTAQQTRRRIRCLNGAVRFKISGTAQQEWCYLFDRYQGAVRFKISGTAQQNLFRGRRSMGAVRFKISGTAQPFQTQYILNGVRSASKSAALLNGTPEGETEWVRSASKSAALLNQIKGVILCSKVGSASKSAALLNVVH
jgi:hypothetical protein